MCTVNLTIRTGPQAYAKAARIRLNDSGSMDGCVLSNALHSLGFFDLRRVGKASEVVVPLIALRRKVHNEEKVVIASLSLVTKKPNIHFLHILKFLDSVIEACEEHPLTDFIIT